MKRWFINMFIYLLINCYQVNSQIISSVDKWMEYVEEMVKLRLQNLQFSYEDYQPLEMPKIENAVIETKGLYTAFIVCADPAPVQDVFEKAFN